jgi:Uma2 family endonuclease
VGWIVDPVAERIDVYRASDREWLEAGAFEGPGLARLAPFEEVELELAPLWAGG